MKMDINSIMPGTTTNTPNEPPTLATIKATMEAAKGLNPDVLDAARKANGDPLGIINRFNADMKRILP